MALATLTNTANLNAQTNLNKTQTALQNSLSRLSTGQRVNSAAERPTDSNNATSIGSTDVPSTSTVLKISPEAMALSQMDAASSATSAREANEVISNVQLADGALGDITTMLQRAGDLAFMSESGQFETEDQQNISTELASLSNKINQIAQSATGVNGQKLLDGSYQGQSATLNGNRMSVSALPDVAELTGTRNGTLESSASIKKALEAVNTLRGNLSTQESSAASATGVGTADATSNASRLSDLYNSLAVTSAPATSRQISVGESSSESANLTRSQLLQQQGAAILAQANSNPQQVINLLRG